MIFKDTQRKRYKELGYLLEKSAYILYIKKRYQQENEISRPDWPINKVVQDNGFYIYSSGFSDLVKKSIQKYQIYYDLYKDTTKFDIYSIGYYI